MSAQARKVACCGAVEPRCFPGRGAGCCLLLLLLLLLLHTSGAARRPRTRTRTTTSPTTTMGVEKEKSDTSIIMDEDEFNRSIEPILSRKGHVIVSPREDRDPDDINAHLKVSFDDVIAEPASFRTFDRVWICSHATFEVVKLGLYRILGALLAVPLAFLLGLVFAILSLVHIWLVMPSIRSFLVLLPSLQVVWRSLTDTFVLPFFRSLGRTLSSVHIQHLDQ